MKRLAGSLVVSSLALVACGGDLSLPTAETSSGGGGAPGTSSAAASGGSSAAGAPNATPKRTVSRRNPFGNAAAGNLLADGDFELTGRQGQMAWFSNAGSTGETIDYRTGGACRSGVRCAHVPADGRDLVGFLASPKEGGVDVSLWAKPSSGACTDMRLSFLDLDGNTMGADVPLVSDTPDEDGWCHFSGAGPSYPGRMPALYFRFVAGAKGDAVVDDGVVVASKARTSRGLVATVPSALELERIRAIAAAIRRRVPAPLDFPER